MAKQLSSQDFHKQLELLAATFRQTIEAEVDGFTTDPDAQRQRIQQCRHDFEQFARTYFPHYVTYDASELHRYLFEQLPLLIADPRGKHLALAAPRGEAKSTIVALIFVIWVVVYELKHYPCIIMDVFEQAATMLEAVKAELEANPRLLMDFPKATGQGRTWQHGVITTANNCKIQAFGSGQKVRGKRHGPHRPDLIVGDDLENDENVRKPEQREKLENWIKKAVLKMGAADDSADVVIIGTVLHYDSVLNRLLNNPLWMSKRFQAIIQWPDNMALWEQFEHRLLTTVSDDDNTNAALEAAMAFYHQHQAEMDAGARVSWPAARPLVNLMITRARDGHDAFDSEYQNDPTSGDNAPFAHCINFWVNRLPEWVFYGACDPSLGKEGRGRDPSAILVGGFNRSTGILDVVEAEIRKRLPDRIISDVIRLHREYGCLVWGIETVQFQEFLRTELIKRSSKLGMPVPARAITPHADKLLRIESLQPHMANGLIRLHASQSTLTSQLKHFPKADHDDGPDALHMLWMLAATGAIGLPAIHTPKHSPRHTKFYGY